MQVEKEMKGKVLTTIEWMVLTPRLIGVDTCRET